MTEQDAIKALTYLKTACTNKSDTVKALDTAIKALIEIKKYREVGTLEECRENKDKQEPKKVTDLHVDAFTCPSCGYEDTTLDYKQVPKYCRNCGQALYD